MQKLRQWFSEHEWLAHVLSGLGVVAWAVQALLVYARNLPLMMDEGAYLYKGYTFAIGMYTPFQDYGPAMNKPPLAFLIPGYVQAWFGTGLREGRYFSIVMGLVMLAGMWLIAKRIAGSWPAAAAVWIMTLDQGAVYIYSYAISQALAAAVLVWTLVPILGTKKKLWNVVIAGVMSALLVFVRQNMILVIPILLLYILWEYGWKYAGWATLAAGLTFIIEHAIYWPNVLSAWALVVPATLSPFLDAWRPPVDMSTLLYEENNVFSLLLSFFHTFSSHYIILLGGLVILLLWPGRKIWTSSSSFHTSVFLAVLFWSLTLFHAWATLGHSYCLFCFSVYIPFFAPLGALAVVDMACRVNIDPGRLRRAVIFPVLLVFSLGTSYSFFETIGRPLAAIPMPRLRGGWFSDGWTDLGTVLINKFHLNYNSTYKLVSAGLGPVIFLLALLIAWGLWKWLRKSGRMYPFQILFTVLLFVSGWFLTAGYIPRIDLAQNQCGSGADILSSVEQAGHYMAGIIPSGSLVYWDGGGSIAPLLYVHDIRTFPAQYNTYAFYLRDNPNTDALWRLGWWNAELEERWRREADFIIIAWARYNAEWDAFLKQGSYTEYPSTNSLVPCDSSTSLRIFERQ